MKNTLPIFIVLSFAIATTIVDALAFHPLVKVDGRYNRYNLFNGPKRSILRTGGLSSSFTNSNNNDDSDNADDNLSIPVMFVGINDDVSNNDDELVLLPPPQRPLRPMNRGQLMRYRAML